MPANDKLRELLGITKTHAPDPLDPGRFKQLDSSEPDTDFIGSFYGTLVDSHWHVSDSQLRVGCQWCRGSYAQHQDNCPNCGAPNPT